MKQYNKVPPKSGMQSPDQGGYEKTPPSARLKKPKFEPPPPPPVKRKKDIQNYVHCPDHGLIHIFFNCNTKARYCSANCSCDEVCQDTSCPDDCVPNCRCDSHCSDCYDEDYWCRLDT